MKFRNECEFTLPDVRERNEENEESERERKRTKKVRKKREYETNEVF